MKQEGHGYFRKSKAYGLVCGIALAGTLMVSQGVKADELVEVMPDVTITANPATNLPEAQPETPAEAVALASEAGTQIGELVSEITSDSLDKAVSNATEAGVTVTTENKVVYDSLDKAQADLAKQETAVKEATAKQEANTEAIDTAIAENQAIDKANADEKARVDALNKKGEADTKAKNEAGQKAVDEANQKAKAEAYAENVKRQAEYDKAVAEREAVIASNAEKEAKHKTDQKTYQTAQAEFEQAEKAYRDAVKAKAQAEATNATNQADYEAKLAEYEEAKKAYDSAKADYDKAVKAKEQALASNATNQAEYEAKLAEYERQKADYDRKKAEYDRQVSANTQSQSDYTKAKAEYDKALADYKAKVQAQIERLKTGDGVKLEVRQVSEEFISSYSGATVVEDGDDTSDIYDGYTFISPVNMDDGTGNPNGQFFENGYYSLRVNSDSSFDEATGEGVVVINSITIEGFEVVTNRANTAYLKDHGYTWKSPDGTTQHSYQTQGGSTGYMPVNVTYAINETVRLRPGQSSSWVYAGISDPWWIEQSPSRIYLRVAYDPSVEELTPPTPPKQPESNVPQPPTPPVKPTPPTGTVPNVPAEPTPPKAPQPPTPVVVPSVPDKPQPPTPPTPPSLADVPPAPEEPEFVTPVIKTFTPEVYIPVDPKVTPHVTVPNKENHKAKVHPVEVKQAPTNVKAVVNEDKVSINGMLVPKGHLVHWELSNAPLKAGREETTSYTLIDPFPAGFEVDEKASSEASPAWFISKNEVGTTILVATQATLDRLNADLTKDVTIPVFTAIGRPLNDGATYENTFKTIIQTPKGQYTVTSNTPVIYTPGNDPKTPRPPHPSVPERPENPTPNDNLIQPKKDVVDSEGVSINGKQVLPNTPINYVLTQDFDQYEGMVASKEAIGKGFVYVDDYQDDALDGQSMVVKSIKAKNGDDVSSLLEKYHVLSKDSLDEKLAELVKASGISPVGEFYLWVAKDPASFFTAYVQKGLDITYNLSFKIKDKFVGTFTNQTFQIDFGNGYYGNIVENNVPELTVNKDVIIDGKAVDKGEVKLGDSFEYVLEGWVIPADRGYDIEEYRFVDIMQSSHDEYQGFKVKAKVDMTLSDGTRLEKGTDLSQYVTQTYNVKTGAFELKFNEEFLSQIPRSSAFGSDVILQAKRIKSGTVENEFTLYVNGIPVKSDKVITETPEPPKPPKPSPKTPEKPVLPKTGDVGSVLAMVGTFLSGLGMVALKRKKD